MKHEPFNESIEMYLKTACELAVGDTPVAISALAGRLGVSAVSATEMVHRLQEDGLVEHQPYKGIILTDDGRHQAAGVIRSHRLWECFLADRLGLPWDEVHELACRLEHATDPQVTDALDLYLGYPLTCPHGSPIPAPDGTIVSPTDRPLMSLSPGQSAIISRIYPETAELLSYLGDLGLITGVKITLKERAPFHGPLVLLVGDDIRYLGGEGAAQLFVHPIEENAQ